MGAELSRDASSNSDCHHVWYKYRRQISVAGEEYIVSPSAKNPLLPVRIPLNKPVSGTSRGGLDAFVGCIGDISVTTDVRAVLLAEMLARTAKSMIREYLRTAARVANVSTSANAGSRCLR